MFRSHAKATVTCDRSPRLAIGIEQTVRKKPMFFPLPGWKSRYVNQGDYTTVTGSEKQKYLGIGYFTPYDYGNYDYDYDIDPPDWDEDPGPSMCKCVNQCNSSIDFQLGEYSRIAYEGMNQRFEPIILWKDIVPSCTVTFSPKLILLGYAIKNYKGNGPLFDKIESEPTWSQDISLLDDETSWNLVQDKTTGTMTVERADVI
ncbi:hypothetical protein AG1IA_09031 [Rhizoctonia solani AG-1 IA]|uniref:Uncharacterized protein n=1 Tax=Thanatephorus cucumeris (strain AG1-IA) TaxID=983506 RepID=L8WJM9_THACA|nr:hypothetical protein AG1IA_09031 [Rhizoctonia solani AG-1 IA]